MLYTVQATQVETLWVWEVANGDSVGKEPLLHTPLVQYLVLESLDMVSGGLPLIEDREEAMLRVKRMAAPEIPERHLYDHLIQIRDSHAVGSVQPLHGVLPRSTGD